MDYRTQSTIVTDDGHLGVPTGFALTEEERRLLLEGTSCPIHHNLETKMTKDGFIKACLHHIDNVKRTLALKTTANLTSGDTICSICPIGKAIVAGDEFTPHNNVTFIELNVVPRPVVLSKQKQRNRAKLTESDVKHIRQLDVDGLSVTAIQKRYPQVLRPAIYKIINRITWKDI